jgi:hypothetical protein
MSGVVNQPNGIPIEPGACAQAAAPESSLGRLLGDVSTALNARPEADVVLVRDLVTAMERNSFPLLLLLFSLLLVSPLSAVPGATSLFGLTIAAILTQRLLGRSQVWLPAILLDRRLPARRTEQALRWLPRPVGWLEHRLVQQRQRWVLDAPFVQVPMAVVLITALCAPLLEVIPGSGTSVGAAISLFSAGLLARDGLFVLAGASLAAILPVSLWLLLT